MYTKKTRNQTIDVLKGCLIILVILGHSIQYGYGYEYWQTRAFYNNYLFRAIYTFHMPLFMILSGYLFHSTFRKSAKTVISSRFKKIGLPWIAYCTIIYFIQWIFTQDGHFYLLDYLNKLSINMWFLSSVLINTLIVALIMGLVRLRWLANCVLWLFALATWFIPDGVLTAAHKFMFVFFLLGFYLPCRIGAVKYILKGKLSLLLLTVGFVFCVLAYKKPVFIYNNDYCVLKTYGLSWDSLSLNLERGVIGIVGSCWFVSLIINFEVLIKRVTPLLTHFGMQTLAMYGFQSVLFAVICEFVSLLKLNMPHSVVVPLLLLLIMVIVCEVLVVISKKGFATRTLFLGQ